MRCPFCAHEDSQVKDSRPSEDGAAIRRRRQCEACGARFTTFERVQLRDLTGAIYSFFKSELAEFHKDIGVSPMPVYAAVFTPIEMDDMVAYLVSLRGKKPSANL